MVLTISLIESKAINTFIYLNIMVRPDKNDRKYYSDGSSCLNEYLYTKALEEYIDYLERIRNN